MSFLLYICVVISRSWKLHLSTHVQGFLHMGSCLIPRTLNLECGEWTWLISYSYATRLLSYLRRGNDTFVGLERKVFTFTEKWIWKKPWNMQYATPPSWTPLEGNTENSIWMSVSCIQMVADS